MRGREESPKLSHSKRNKKNSNQSKEEVKRSFEALLFSKATRPKMEGDLLIYNIKLTLIRFGTWFSPWFKRGQPYFDILETKPT